MGVLDKLEQRIYVVIFILCYVIFINYYVDLIY